MAKARAFAVAGLVVATLAACASPAGLAPRSSGVADANGINASRSLAGLAKPGAWLTRPPHPS